MTETIKELQEIREQDPLKQGLKHEIKKINNKDTSFVSKIH